MNDVNNFFLSRNTLHNVSDEEKKQTTNYVEAIKAFARAIDNSTCIIDYQKKRFELVSAHPLFLCGHTEEEVKKMGYLFYFNYVIPEDLELLLKINTIGFDFYDKIPIEERIFHSISYDFHLKNQEGKVLLINQKLTPLSLTNEGKIWKTICIISISNEQSSGNIKISKKGENKIFRYNLKGDFWEVEEKNKII